MNQEQNNFNLNNFNTQDNNGISNNQPLNNQNFNQYMGFNQHPINPKHQTTPSYGQQITQESTLQPINNTFETGNANNQSFNNKTPKKINLGLIIGIVVGIVIAGVIVLVNVNNKETDSSSNNGVEKKQIYLNKNYKSIDKVSFILNNSYKDDITNVFIGINYNGIASNLTPDITSLNNSIARYTTAQSSEFSLQKEDQYISFSQETESYKTKENKTQEFIDDQLVLFKKDGYYIANTNISKYILYYKFAESMYDGFRDGELHGTWDLLTIGYYNTLEEAQNKINELNSILDICTYRKQDGIENCKTFDNKNIDYKQYRYFSDIVLEMLKKYDLYVESYENISLKNGDIIISSDSTVSQNRNTFTLAFSSGTIKIEDYTEFELNNQKFYIKDNAICYEKNGIVLAFYVQLPYDVEKTETNIINEFKNAFSKTEIN